MKHKQLTRRIGVFSLAILLSRILGYVRDALVASFFGGGGVTDAFYAAFKIPNLLRRFLGEGSLTAAFVPVLTLIDYEKGKAEADRFFQSLFSGLLVVLLALAALAMAFAPQLTHLIAWGFTRDPDKFKLTADLVRMTFPFIILASLAALVSAVLNANGRFFVSGVAPSGLSVAEIIFIVALASRMESPIYGLAAAALAGGALHFLWQIPGLYKEGYHLKWSNPFRHPEVRSVLFLMIPAIIGLSADQVNSFINQLCASFLRDGSITALYNSNRVMQFPLALFGVAISSVALPTLSKSISQGNIDEFKSTLRYSIRISNYVLIPSVIGLSVLGFPIIQVLFQHGQFSLDNSRLTYAALLPYCLGLPAFATSKILASSFYAMKNTQTPMKLAVLSMMLNAILNVILMPFIQVSGLALATSIAAWFQVIALFLVLRKRMGLLGGREIMKSFLLGSLSGLAMGGFCSVLYFIIFKTLPSAVNVFLTIGLGAAFYLFLSKALKIREFDEFLHGLILRSSGQ